MSTLNRLELGRFIPNTKKEQLVGFQYKITSKDYILSSGSLALKYNPTPLEFELNQVYPNPFNPKTTFSFVLPMETEVSLSIYNLQGREVTTLISGSMNAGYHSVIWNANQYSSGVYFVKMVAGEYVTTQKLMLVK